MTITVQAATISGSVQAPPSKSHTHRALVLAALSGNGSVRGALRSNDTQATLAGLQALGFLASEYPHEIRVGGQLRAPRDPIDAQESGTTLRLLTGTASLLGSEVRLTAASRLRERPMAPLLDALSALGVHTRSTPTGWSIRGPQQGGQAQLRGDVSSQFVSALLLSAPLSSRPTTIRIDGPLISRPYVEITLAQLRHHGIRINARPDGFDIPAPQTVRQKPYAVPGDYSSAAFLLAAAAITQGSLRVGNLVRDDPQGDRAIVEVLRRFGAQVIQEPEAVRVEGAPLAAADVDIGPTPDLFPILCAVAAVAKGTSVLRGAPHLRAKESDRIRAMADNLHAAGIEAHERPDGIEIRGGIPKGINIKSFNDHRVAMACLVLGLAARGPSTLPDEDVVTKSYPDFHKDLRSVTAEVARR